MARGVKVKSARPAEVAPGSARHGSSRGLAVQGLLGVNLNAGRTLPHRYARPPCGTVTQRAAASIGANIATAINLNSNDQCSCHTN